MKKYFVVFQRDFEVEVEAESTADAAVLARQIVAQFPAGTCKLLSIKAEDYVEPPEPATPPSKPRGRPNGGGTPGTPVVKKEVLADAIAEAA
jgi:hypothetical protein